MSDIQTKLSDLKIGEEAVISKVDGKGAFRKRITEMGFVTGKTVTKIKHAPMQDPVEYEIMGYNVSLRLREAENIQIISKEAALKMGNQKYAGVLDCDGQKISPIAQKDIINVALVGNPNCGKTTLFNYASGSHERVGNYAGVTIDAKEAKYRFKNKLFNITDLPGTYSITEYSPEELYVREFLTDNMPDVVINVVDASNLERNLYLTTQLIDMNVKVVIALNMYDDLQQSGAKFDYEYLGKMIGIPIIPTIASKGTGLKDLFAKVIDVYENNDPFVREVNINYGKELEKSLLKLSPVLADNCGNEISPRYLAIKLLEDDKTSFNWLESCNANNQIAELAISEQKRVEAIYDQPAESLITDAKYGFISGALLETYKSGVEVRRKSSRAIDKILTNKHLGVPIFIFFMWLTFQATFTLGSYPMDWIDAGVGMLANWIDGAMAEGALKSLVIDGIIGGVGGVIIFLPNILILFFFISLMEDTGYMARTAFIMDKLMHKIGLHGKSFIPMVMGFGCNVPAIMATRTIENKNDRLLTMLITPFMSCSARLPVYVLLISAFFPKNQGIVMFSIYLIGIVLAVLFGLLFKNTFFKKKEIPFVMELPPYRVPTLRNTLKHMWNKGSQYLQKMGGVILIASVLIWALGYFPREVDFSKDYDTLIAQTEASSQISETAKEMQVADLVVAMESERQEKSYIGQLGHAIEPIIAPLGYDWKIGVSILTGLAAKEIVVSSMGILYKADMEADESSEALVSSLQQQTFKSGDKAGKKVFSPLIAFSLMLFILIYFPCVAVIAAIKKEANWKWALFTMGYTTGAAWLVSLLTYQIGSLFI